MIFSQFSFVKVQWLIIISAIITKALEIGFLSVLFCCRCHNWMRLCGNVREEMFFENSVVLVGGWESVDTVIGNREQFFFFLFVSGLTFVSISFSFEGESTGQHKLFSRDEGASFCCCCCCSLCNCWRLSGTRKESIVTDTARALPFRSLPSLPRSINLSLYLCNRYSCLLARLPSS